MAFRSAAGRLDVERVRRRLAEAREEIAAAAARGGRRAEQVEILVATKYVAADDLPVLAEAGVRLVGENRAQDLQAKASLYGGRFTWDFIGQLQSRRVRAIVPHVRLIHSVASHSALAAIGRCYERAPAGLGVLIEVNVAREPGKAGVAPEGIDELIAASPVPVRGLMAMPPQAERPEQSRRWFVALRELAGERGLQTLSMGTSQDYTVAVEEGATIVRLGRHLYA